MSDVSMREILLQHHKDELEDHEKYIELAKMAYEKGFDCAAGILEDIAHDEETHATAIKHILEKEVY